MIRLEDLPIRISARIDPDGSVWFPGERPPPRPKRKAKDHFADSFGKKCCGTPYGKPHVEGCKRWH